MQATHKKNHKKNTKPSYTENASYQFIPKPCKNCKFLSSQKIEMKTCGRPPGDLCPGIQEGWACPPLLGSPTEVGLSPWHR